MALDIAALRADTPGTGHVTHLNNAGAALPPQPVIDAVRSYLDEEVLYGGYETAERRHDEIEGTYDVVARLIGARRREIAVVDNATRAWQQAFGALASSFEPGDRILTTTSEYAANYIAYLQAVRRIGIAIEVVPDTPEGVIDVSALADRLDDRVKLISLNHIPTHNGLVHPAAAVGEVASAAGIPYLLDACQSVGQLPIDVAELRCDFLVATSRKFLRGPRGMGFLYTAERSLEDLEPMMLDLHGARWLEGNAYEMRPDARRFEVWEQNTAAKVGFRAAIEYSLGVGLDESWERIQQLGARLRGLLGGVPGVEVHDRGSVRCGIVTFTVHGRSPSEVKAFLGTRDINVSMSTVWSSRYDMERTTPHGVVRASVHYYNTEDEVDRVVAAIADLPAP